MTFAFDEKAHTLTITIPDYRATLKPSSSGKSVIVATSGASAAIVAPDGTQLNLGVNVYRKT